MVWRRQTTSRSRSFASLSLHNGINRNVPRGEVRSWKQLSSFVSTPLMDKKHIAEVNNFVRDSSRMVVRRKLDRIRPGSR
jgi:hypothetical protein